MTDQTNTITNLPQTLGIAFNDVFPIDNTNSLNIAGLPISESASALQVAEYIYRALGIGTFIAICEVASTANLTATYSNGTSGVGATLTNSSAQAALVLDGVTVLSGWRVFIINQTDETQNGIYTVTIVGSASTNWVLTRATDYDEAAEILLGTFSAVRRGSTLLGQLFVNVSVGVVVGTSNIVFKNPLGALISATNALYVSGAYNCIITLSNHSFPIFPAGIRLLATTKGVTTAASAAAGQVGETLQAALVEGSAAPLSNGVNTDIISLPYTAGSWSVSVCGSIIYSGVTNTSNLVFVGTASGDNQTGLSIYNAAYVQHPTNGASGKSSGTIPTFQFNTNSSGTLYVKINSAFTVGTITGFGCIQMVRNAQSE